MRQEKRNAFTLVELLVVITIIGMLMALLLPAVNSAIGSARNVQCKNQIGQLGKAVATYESRMSRFPSYTEKSASQSSASGGSSSPALSWMISLLTDMERQDITDQWQAGNPVTPFMNILTCPSDPPLDSAKPWTSYVANAGLNDGVKLNKNDPYEVDVPYCGVFNIRLEETAANGKKKVYGVTTTTESLGDGSAKTMLFTENVQASTWAEPSTKTGSNYYNIFVWDRNGRFSESGSGQRSINADLNAGDQTRSTYARPSSRHSGGVNVAFCDSHVEFMREGIDYAVYVQLMTPDGKRCAQEASKYGVRVSNNLNLTLPLNDIDYQ